MPLPPVTPDRDAVLESAYPYRTQPATLPVVQWIRRLLALTLWLYAIGLSSYLLLRLLLQDAFWLLAWASNFAPFYFLPLVLALPIGILLRAKRLSSANLILLLIGAVWFVPKYLPDNLFAGSPDYNTSLKVVTFNIWGNNNRLDDLIAWLQESEADLVLLQEVPPAWAGATIPGLEAVFPYQVSQPYDLRPWGDAILSRHPILTHDRYALLNGHRANDRVEIDLNGTVVAVYNVHLFLPQGDTWHFRPPVNNSLVNMLARYDDTRRNQQIDRLLEILESEDKPFIVGGDFNTSDNAVVYGQMTNHWTDSFREAGIGMGGTWPSAPAGFPRFVPAMLRIDYIWHSDALVTLSAEVGPDLGSDHYPVIAALGLIHGE